MDKSSARYERQVEKAIEIIVPMICQETEDDGCCPIEVPDLKRACATTVYAFNEAMGRLKAIGFISKRKNFIGESLQSRTDGKRYYYQVELQSRPDLLSEEVKAERLEKRAWVLARKRQEERHILQLMMHDDPIAAIINDVQNKG